MSIVTIENIPVYDAIISDEDTGMMKISLVDDPAVMSNFQAFDSKRKQLLYSIEDEEKRLVRGVVMRADFPIYRRDDYMGEYYIIYKADQIRKMAEKYLVDGLQNAVNVMHQKDSDVEGVQMVQYFIKGNGVSVEGFDNIADGSLFAEFHVINDEVWNRIKDGTYRGFSLEGYFDLEPEQDIDNVAEIVKKLNGLFSKIKDMTKKEKVMAALQSWLVKCGNVTTDKGILSWEGDDELEAGMAVFVEDSEGAKAPAEDGEYVVADGKKIIVADGKVAEIVDPEAEIAPAAEPEVEPEAPVAEEQPVEAEEEPAVEEAPVAEEPAPAEPEFDVRKEIADIWEAIAALKAMVEQKSEEIAEFKKQPMAKPAHEEVMTAEKIGKTGIKGLDNLSRFCK